MKPSDLSKKLASKFKSREDKSEVKESKVKMTSKMLSSMCK